MPVHIEVLDLPVPVDVVDGKMAVHYGHNVGKASVFTTVFEVEIEFTNCLLYPARTGCEFQMSRHMVHSMPWHNVDTSVEANMCI